MSIKIIALACSPSRGRNSDTMLDHFILGMKEISGVEVQKIYLEDIPIDNYRFENKNGPTSHEVLFGELCEKISKEVEGLVIATPTYNFSVPAHLKNFVDRSRYFALDLTKRNFLGQPVGKLKNLKMYFLVSGGTPRWAEHILFFAFPALWLRGVFLYMGAKVFGAYYSGDVQTFKNERILKKCFHKGKKYAKKVSQGRSQGILERIFFRPPTVE